MIEKKRILSNIQKRKPRKAKKPEKKKEIKTATKMVLQTKSEKKPVDRKPKKKQ